MTYKVGDSVTIRPNLRAGEVCGVMKVSSGMLDHGGAQALITEVSALDFYRIDVDDGRYGWTDNMFVAHRDAAQERLLSLSNGLRESVAKQLIFDCAMELLYKTENIPNDVLANKLMNALQALDTE